MTGDQRVVISARLIGAVQRHTPKLKVGSTKLDTRCWDALKSFYAVLTYSHFYFYCGHIDVHDISLMVRPD